MKILLVQSYLGGGEPLVYPMGLSCLKAALSEHEVRTLDLNVHSEPFRKLSETLGSFEPDVVGISLRNIDSTNKRTVVFYYSFLKDTLDAIRASSKAKIVVGGSGFSMFGRRIMEDQPGIDYGVALEGEITFPSLLANLGAPEKVASVFYRKNGELLFTEGGAQMSLDEARLPDRTSFPIDDYRKVRDAVGIETKRGCILDCIYCIYGFLNGKKLRLRSPSKVVDEIERLVGEHGLNRFTFVDSVFNIPAKHCEEICREIIRRNLNVSWSAWFNEKALTREQAELSRDAGCTNFILSPDGFSDDILKSLGKNIRMADIMRSYEILRDLPGFEVSYNFFKNPPGQNLRAFLSLVSFYFRAKKEMGRRVHFEFNSIRIEPHTRLFETALAEGFVVRDEDLLYPKYYTQRSTEYIETIFNVMLRLKGK